MAQQALFSSHVSWPIWYCQVKEVSTVIPKNFKLWAAAIFLLPNDTCYMLISQSILVKNCKKYVLSQFSVNKLLWNHLFISLSISQVLNSNSISLWFTVKKDVSSANKIGLNLSDTLLERSLMYIRNNNGPRTKPCGTPCCTSSHLEKYPFELLWAFMTTLWYLLNRISLTYLQHLT